MLHKVAGCGEGTPLGLDICKVGRLVQSLVAR